MAEREAVIMVHGLGRTARMFWRMKRALEEAGFDTQRYHYPSVRYNVPTSTAMFRGYLMHVAENWARGKRVHLVGFSLGALLIRGALSSAVPGLDVGRLVLIAPPNQGAGFLKKAGARIWARRLFGPAIGDFVEGSDYLRRLGAPDHEIGVIAGTKRFLIVNPTSYLNLIYAAKGELHDGTVEVQNTVLDGMTGFVTVAANHTFIAHHPATISQTIRFLKEGTFEHGAEAVLASS